jgi:upstream activation factor subunit UAF30
MLCFRSGRGDSSDESSGEEWGRTRNKSKTPRKKKAADSDEEEDSDGEPKPKKKRGGGGGFTKPMKLSDDLAAIVGKDVAPRHEVVKQIWAYIKENNLQDPKNKQFAKCDDKLMKVIGTKKFRCFGMAKFLKDHMELAD